MEPPEVIDKTNKPPMSEYFDLNLIPDDPILENHSSTNENTAPSSANLEFLNGQDVPKVDFDWDALEFKTITNWRFIRLIHRFIPVYRAFWLNWSFRLLLF
ncbi:hypothetical protein LINPERPRIM_LOCUS13380 [Linum perenne]